VLREVVALQTGRPRPALSTLFGTELRVTDTQLFAELTGDVSRLGVREEPTRRRKGKRTGGSGVPVAAVPAAGAPAAPGAMGHPVPGVPGQRAPGAAPLSTPPTHVRGGNGTAAALPYEPPRAAVPAPRPAPAGPDAYASAGPRLTGLDARTTSLALPVPRVDANDPNAGFLAGVMTSAPSELIAALQAVPAASLETRLRELRARLELNEPGAAVQTLTGLEALHADDWRVVWYRGITSLVTGDNATAALSFDAVYDAFPGEPAPKLALGICAEVLGQLDNAAEYYHLVWATDPSFVSAAFGLARVQIAVGDRAGAVRTLESVPEASIHYTAARVAAVRARLRERAPHEPLIADLTAAAEQVTGLQIFGLDAVRREQLSTEVLGTALDWVLSGSPTAQSPAPQSPSRSQGPAGPSMLLGSELDERGLRFGLERSYRMLARLAQRGDERIELVERANRFRPRTWV
jgi:serine/threonine-protein kinase PknG